MLQTGAESLQNRSKTILKYSVNNSINPKLKLNKTDLVDNLQILKTMKRRKITQWTTRFVISFSSIQNAIFCHSELLLHDPYCAMINPGKMKAVCQHLMGFRSALR